MPVRVGPEAGSFGGLHVMNRALQPLAPVRRYILKRTPNTNITDTEVDMILSTYKEVCEASGVSMRVALVQMLEDSSALLAPHAQENAQAPARVLGYYMGSPLAFPAYVEAVRVHVGLLLAMRWLDEEVADEYQRNLVDDALKYYPEAPRGSVAMVVDMAPLWSHDPEYLQKLEATALAVDLA